MKPQRKVRVDKKILTFFLIAFPTLLIILLGAWVKDSWFIQIALALYQFILLKQYLDNYYEVLE